MNHGFLRRRARIPGWLSPVDALLIQMADASQRAVGVGGDLLEIGTYFGRTAVLLGSLLRADEELYVCDLFETEPADGANAFESRAHYPDLTRRAFEENYLLSHGRLPQILQCSSTLLGDLDLGRRFRIVHVDGCHQYGVVKSDLANTHSMTREGGVVVVDDFRNPGLPGVTAAVWEAILVDDLRPLCLTASKMYATWDHSSSAMSRRFLQAVAGDQRLRTQEHVLFDAPILSVRSEWRARIEDAYRRVRGSIDRACR